VRLNRILAIGRHTVGHIGDERLGGAAGVAPMSVVSPFYLAQPRPHRAARSGREFVVGGPMQRVACAAV